MTGEGQSFSKRIELLDKDLARERQGRQAAEEAHGVCQDRVHELQQELAASENPRDAINLLEKFVNNLTPRRASGRSSPRDRLSSAVPATSGATGSVRRMPNDEEEFLAGFKQARGL